jgi:hypothetical protein
MKRIIVVAILLLFGLVGFVCHYRTRRIPPTFPNEGRGIGRLEIYDWGTLKSLTDKSGKPIYGKEKPANEGYLIVYQVLDPKTGKPKGELRSIFAIGTTFSRERFVQVVSNGVKIDAKVDAEVDGKVVSTDAVCATATTVDKVLKIDSNFYLDPQTGALNIVRIIQNISEDNVRLVAVRTLHDTGLVPRERTRFGIVDLRKTKTVELKNISYTPPASKMPRDFAPGFLAIAADPFEVPCTLCPPYCFVSVSVNPGDVKVYCVKCMDENLEVDPSNGVDCPDGTTGIRIEGWDRLPAGQVGASQWGTICVSCNNHSVESAVIPGAGGGALSSTVDKMRREGKCALQIDFDRGDGTAPVDLTPKQAAGINQSLHPTLK